MTTLKKTAIAVTTVLLTLGAITAAHAAGSNCQIIYGGGQVCQQQIKFTIDKKVLQPTKGGTYVDNLSANDTHFQPGNDVAFQITITNTGKQTINQFSVVDTLPANLSFISGAGTYNSSNNTITYSISNLGVGASNQQIFVARIADSKMFAQNQVTCLTNIVNANDNVGDNAGDTSSFCIENPLVSNPTPQVFATIPPKSIPNTGPEMLPLLGLIPAGLAGFVMRKKSKIN